MAVSETIEQNQSQRYSHPKLTPEQPSVLDGIDELRSSAVNIEYNVEYDLPVGTVWAALIDSERIERQAGLPPFIFSFRNAGEGRIAFGENKIGPLTVKFYELPFEWEEERWTSLERIFLGGPFKYMRGQFFYSPTADGLGTKIKISFDVTGRLGKRVTKFLFHQSFKSLLAAMDEIARGIIQAPTGSHLTSVSEQVALLTPNPAPGTENKINRLAAQLKAMAPDARQAATLAEIVFTRPDNILRRLRPYVYADAFGFDREETLVFFLEAVKAGKLDMSWDLLCPSCQGPGSQAGSLDLLENGAHCDVCDIAYDAALDENVELTFRPNPAVREISLVNFCPAAPANTRHISHTYYVEPNARAVKQLRLAPGDYRFALNKNERVAGLTVLLDEETTVIKSDTLWQNSQFTAGTNLRLVLDNPGAQIVTYKVERLESRSDIVTASVVTSLQRFRRLFGSEVLRPGVEIGVQNITVLFSDLKSSTSLYENIGDAGAFKLVQDHFDALEQIIAGSHGAIVKTIGDSVMAVFTEPLNAVKAGLVMLDHFAPDGPGLSKNGRGLDIHDLQIKIGAHRGACIALNLNDRLDYFGSTVNLAARLQSLAKGDDMILSQEIWSAEGVRDAIRKQKEKQAKTDKDIEIRKGKKEIKGLEGEKIVYQVKRTTP